MKDDSMGNSPRHSVKHLMFNGIDSSYILMVSLNLISNSRLEWQ